MPGPRTPAAVPEMPDKYFTGGHPFLLLTTADREGPGRRGSHFMASPPKSSSKGKHAGGLNLMLDFLPSGDPYHAIWNNFKWACKHAQGHLEATNLQMTVPYNANYNPYLKAANLRKKEEFAADFRQIAPIPPAEFEELLEAITLDELDVVLKKQKKEDGGGAR